MDTGFVAQKCSQIYNYVYKQNSQEEKLFEELKERYEEFKPDLLNMLNIWQVYYRHKDKLPPFSPELDWFYITEDAFTQASFNVGNSPVVVLERDDNKCIYFTVEGFYFADKNCHLLTNIDLNDKNKLLQNGLIALKNFRLRFYRYLDDLALR